MDQLEIFDFNRRVVVHSIAREHVLDRRVDGKRMCARLHIIQPEDLRHGSLLSRGFHRSHNPSLEAEKIVDETLRF